MELVNQMNVGEWSFTKKHGWRLRTRETNLLVGNAMSGNFDDSVWVLAFFHDPYNTIREEMVIPHTDDVKLINEAWKICMEKLLKKMFVY